MDNFTFSPSDGFLNTDSYPDPASGTAARTQLQSLHTQTRDFLNEQVVSTINEMQGTISTLTQNLSDANLEITSLRNQIEAFSTLFTTSGLRLVVDDVTYAITVNEGNVVATEVV